MSPTLPNLVLVKCNWCSRSRPASGVHRLKSNQVICEQCIDWHNLALDFLGGGFPKGCQECQRTWDVLKDESTDPLGVRMYVVPKDGIYQILCAACVTPFAAKRKDLYRGTAYGRFLKLD